MTGDDVIFLRCDVRVPAKIRHVRSARKPLQKFEILKGIREIEKTYPTQAFVVSSPIDVRVIESIFR